MTAKDQRESRRQFMSEIGRDAAALLLPVAVPGLLRAQPCQIAGNTLWGLRESLCRWGYRRDGQTDCQRTQSQAPIARSHPSPITVN